MLYNIKISHHYDSRFNIMFSSGKVISRQNALENTILYKVSATQIVYYQFKPAINNCEHNIFLSCLPFSFYLMLCAFLIYFRFITFSVTSCTEKEHNPFMPVLAWIYCVSLIFVRFINFSGISCNWKKHHPLLSVMCLDVLCFPDFVELSNLFWY